MAEFATYVFTYTVGRKLKDKEDELFVFDEYFKTYQDAINAVRKDIKLQVPEIKNLSDGKLKENFHQQPLDFMDSVCNFDFRARLILPSLNGYYEIARIDLIDRDFDRLNKVMYGVPENKTTRYQPTHQVSYKHPIY